MANSSFFISGHYNVWTGQYFDPLTGNVDDTLLTFAGTTENGVRVVPVRNWQDVKIDDLGDSVVTSIDRGRNCRLEIDFNAMGPGIGVAMYPDEPDFSIVDGMSNEYVGQDFVGGGLSTSVYLDPVSGINTRNQPVLFYCGRPEGGHGGFELNNKLMIMQFRAFFVPSMYDSGVTANSGLSGAPAYGQVWQKLLAPLGVGTATLG